jgi:peptidoglycan/xylan/chitin deacetylase (PgdA/CDA1 family)
MKTAVCITIDTEFSIGGAFDDAVRNSPIGEQVVLCAADGKEEGLGFLLDAFGEYGARATFFVEALQTVYFGSEPMGRIVSRIRGAGHDVQLHLHPSWLHFRNPHGIASDRPKPNDSCAGRSDDELDDMIRTGLEAFAQWNAPRPVALRTGNMQVDHAVYSAMARAGIPIASNVGLGLFRPSEPELQLTCGRHWIDGVLELPVLSYYGLSKSFAKSLRILSITGSAWPEIKALMEQARREGVSEIVLLTHPFEFVKRRDSRYLQLRRNRVNQERLKKLLAFLRAHDDEFVTTTFAEAKDRWLAEGARNHATMSASRLAGFRRLIHNVVSDAIWAY